MRVSYTAAHNIAIYASAATKAGGCASCAYRHCTPMPPPLPSWRNVMLDGHENKTRPCASLPVPHSGAGELMVTMSHALRPPGRAVKQNATLWHASCSGSSKRLRARRRLFSGWLQARLRLYSCTHLRILLLITRHHYLGEPPAWRRTRHGEHGLSALAAAWQLSNLTGRTHGALLNMAAWDEGPRASTLAWRDSPPLNGDDAHALPRACRSVKSLPACRHCGSPRACPTCLPPHMDIGCEHRQGFCSVSVTLAARASPGAVRLHAGRRAHLRQAPGGGGPAIIVSRSLRRDMPWKDGKLLRSMTS